ncbi:ferritin-like domain-containing protein [Oscillatoria sp. FACHB-1407]|uniref:ferritin-like domain-containing protein n=1 Tax=Oscillatoria sp. FACHB-1407 TaxID=2692847 RepID=UPI001684FF50|nr:ferritin-like domain-containing protein [Oscillatoria sp. FACHB-1407]MBD2464976.1 ferritin-like domain-containing protein [Oscillatoria sp. FACHB-1407]
MNFWTHLLHLAGSGAVAYITAANIRDSKTRPNVLAGFQLAESGSVPFLEALSQRAANEGDEWLAERLARHAQDERRHGQIFAQALKRLNKQVIDFKSLPKTDTDERRRSPFFEAYFEGYSPEQLSPQTIDWMVFFASTYILELDASKEFARMARALPDDDASVFLQKGLLSIASDETGHAAYLHEAMQRRVSYAEAEEAIAHWRTRKVNALLAMVGNLFQRSGKFPSMVQDGVSPEMAALAEEPAAPELASV